MVVPAAAQPALDRVLGNAPGGLAASPSRGSGHSSLAAWRAPPASRWGSSLSNLSLVPPVGTRLTGLTLRDALDTLAREAGYEWREMDGVIVLRPRRAWVALSHPLDIEVEPVRLEEAIAQQALALACAVLGASDSPQMPERRRFSFTFPGGRLIDFLNAAVREHGSLAWSFARTPPERAGLSVHAQSVQRQLRVWAAAFLDLKPAAPVDLQRILARKAVPAEPTENVLDRLVGLGVHDRPLRLHGIHESGLRDLATAARVPMGVEKVRGPAADLLGGLRRNGRSAAVGAGRAGHDRSPLRVAPPRRRGGDSAARRLGRSREPTRRPCRQPYGCSTSPSASWRARSSVSSARGRPSQDFPDNRLVWLDLAPGTALDLLCALARAHGDLVWAFEELEPRTRRSPASGTVSGGSPAAPAAGFR